MFNCFFLVFALQSIKRFLPFPSVGIGAGAVIISGGAGTISISACGGAVSTSGMRALTFAVKDGESTHTHSLTN